MPTYDYVCEKCGYHFEQFHGINAEKEKICPECGSKVRQVIGNGGGIIFKGKGFYTTDYANKKSIS
ncbi:zinc ribbon domain-containing protein [candidate division KSB1 bacterium]|nr:zinc ribbon domain-containing protein [candidate division KSB1 bacterium]